jgi:hypothetical protein
MEMSVREKNELIRCSICNKVVPKQQYCPKCGKLLIKNMKNIPTKVEATDIEIPEEDSNANPTDQLESLRKKMKKSENIRIENVENDMNDGDLILNSESEELLVEEERILVRNTDSKDIVLDDSDSSEVNITSITENINFKPDKYTLETVQKIAKNIKYESYLVNLLKGDEIAHDAFFRLYNGLADDTHKMIVRRGELITEIDEKIIGYKSTVSTAQQGMKLLNIRKSINDASEEEYKIKAAALKWDLNNYGKKINEEEQKANYLKNLGSLIDEKELDKLTNDVNACCNTLAKLDMEDKAKEKILNSMKDALAVLKETKDL